MAASADPKASLFRETWGAIMASRKAWAPWVLGLSVVLAAVQWFYVSTLSTNPIMEQYRQNPQLFQEQAKQHPEMTDQLVQASFIGIGHTFLYLLVLFAIQLPVFYVLVVTYLRFAMVKSQPELSASGFFHWFGRILWKYIRPVLWNLIPFVGPFFYIRSIVRYEVVTPLAILGRGPELPTSWNLTEGNWWRIFLNRIGLILVMAILVWGVFLIPIVITGMTAQGDFKASLPHAVMSLAQGVWYSMALVVASVYTCTVYRVLLKERRAASPTNPVDA